MNEVFNQLVLGNGDDLPSEVQRNFLSLHNDIMYCGRMAERFVMELARSLKKMKTSIQRLCGRSRRHQRKAGVQLH